MVVQFGNTFFTVPLPFGGQWLKDHKTAVCDSPEMQEAYTRYLDVIYKDRTSTLSPGADQLGKLHDRFYDGQVSMHYILGSRLPHFTDPATYKVDWTMAPLPRGSAAASGDVDTNQVAMTNQATVEESWAFVKWLLEKARYAWFTDRMPTLTADASAWAKENFKRVPATARVEVLVNGLAVARGNDPMRSHPKAGQISSEVHTPFWNAVRDQKMSVKDGLLEAKRKLQGIVSA